MQVRIDHKNAAAVRKEATMEKRSYSYTVNLMVAQWVLATALKNNGKAKRK